MKTIKDVFLNFHQQLDGLYGQQEAEAITLLVLSQVTDLSHAKIKAFPEDDVPPEAIEKLPLILNELKTGKPVQYVLGSAEFYGLTFLVNPAVLIPRPETEELVEWVLSSQRLKVESEKPLSVLDIGTGSGCIAISLKKNLKHARVSAIDISSEALNTAKKNAVINEAEVNFIEADILQIQPGLAPDDLDIIISNPPYVTMDDKAKMHINVNDFEPHTALFVPEHDPLIFYKAIADYAVNKLVDGGLLYFEINESYGQQTVDMLNDKKFINIELRRDMSGRDRMIKAEYIRGNKS
ncbi:peptide chain release factor N(5)-glutamine methyltransferase [Mucilaginibacter pallidiroseus]|uniref:Release factor glutamine methyltransferase n=1 Tax=Mucilaginibacter pallidiroseus TaxID=2599295 RepID=A0A563UIA7_9SPHI|nr:peptide chain release factor N(5)-glutamine methyltransferase [Mucilaginibacter pallidiroseus]TWR31107.1 peptide chain release factor N(5)-glutamine methyltransferase [Mucilaginibacter pallidiroseus]